MQNTDYKKLRKAMHKVQDAKRYEHTLGVAYTAAALAMCYGEDVRVAEIAGLLHDCAKCLSDEKLLSICEKRNISINDWEQKNPYLLHAKVGSFLAMHEYHVLDQEVITAILNHITGRPGMSMLEKIIFIADYIEPSRKKAPRLGQIRKVAFVNLDEAVLQITEDTIQFLEEKGCQMDPMTYKTRDYYKNLCEK
jgi:predicted HD superfamily hydrolase involved in NAD metabolism